MKAEAAAGRPAEILTVGHSTLAIEDFFALLQVGAVEALADVRRYPGSRRHPQFGAAVLAAALADAGVEYAPFGDELGGRRSCKDAQGVDPPDNSAWRSASFRAYADYMATPAFQSGLKRLEELAREKRAAIMCAEAHPSRCHRQVIADALIARGWRVLDILGGGRIAEHELSPHAVAADGRVSYPGQPALDI